MWAQLDNGMGNIRQKPRMIRKGELLSGYFQPNDGNIFLGPQHGQSMEDRADAVSADDPAGEIHPADADNGKAQVGLVIHDLLTAIYHRR